MKQNPFSQFTLTKEATEQKREDQVVIPPKPRPRGRPRNIQLVEQASTIFRLDADTHYKLKKLALHDGLTLNQLLLKCVREHCEKRGIEVV